MKNALLLAFAGCALLKPPPPKEGRIYDASEKTLQPAVISWFKARGIELGPTNDPHVLVSRVKDTDTGRVAGLVQGRSGMGSSIALNTLDPGDINRANEQDRTAQMGDAMRDSTRSFHAELEDAPIRLAEMAKPGTDTFTNQGGVMTGPARIQSSSRETLWGKNRPLYNERLQWKVEFVPVSELRTLVRVYKASTTSWDSSADQSYFIGSGEQLSKTSSAAPMVVVDRDLRNEAALAQHLDFSAAVEVLGTATPEHSVPAVVEAETKTPVAPTAVTLPEEPTAAAASPLSEPDECGIDARQLELKAGTTVLLSDMLGTTEAVRAFRSVICHALKRQLKVTVALSISGAEQPRINAFLTSAGSAADREALLAGPFWHGVWQDGRSSEAMAGLLELLRSWRSQGLPVAVLAVDLGVAGNVRTSYMSARILEHHEANPDRAIIGFLGNAHSSLKAGTDWANDYLPVGYRLLAAGLPVESYDIAFLEGTQWTCHLYALGKLRCGLYEIKPGPRQREPRATEHTAPFISRFPSRSKEGFDGLFFVGRLSPSKPAIAEAKNLGEVQP